MTRLVTAPNSSITCSHASRCRRTWTFAGSGLAAEPGDRWTAEGSACDAGTPRLFQQVPKSQLTSLKGLPFLRQRFGYAVAEIGSAAAAARQYRPHGAQAPNRAWCRRRNAVATVATGASSRTALRTRAPCSSQRQAVIASKRWFNQPGRIRREPSRTSPNRAELEPLTWPFAESPRRQGGCAPFASRGLVFGGSPPPGLGA